MPKKKASKKKATNRYADIPSTVEFDGSYLSSCTFDFQENQTNVKESANSLLTVLEYINEIDLKPSIGHYELTRTFSEGYLQKVSRKTGTDTYSAAKAQCECGAIGPDNFDTEGSNQPPNIFDSGLLGTEAGIERKWLIAYGNGSFSSCGQRKVSKSCVNLNPSTRKFKCPVDGWQNAYCMVCGYALERKGKTDAISFSSDHILPIGPAILLNCINTPCNYAPIHERCNGIKSNYLPVNAEGWDESNNNNQQILINRNDGPGKPDLRWQMIDGYEIPREDVRKYSYSEYNAKYLPTKAGQRPPLSTRVNNEPGFWEEQYRGPWLTYRLFLCALESYVNFLKNPVLQPYQLFDYTPGVKGPLLTLVSDWRKRVNDRVSKYKEALVFSDGILDNLAQGIMVGSKFDIKVKNSIYNSFVDTILNQQNEPGTSPEESAAALSTQLTELRQEYIEVVQERAEQAKVRQEKIKACLLVSLQQQEQEIKDRYSAAHGLLQLKTPVHFAEDQSIQQVQHIRNKITNTNLKLNQIDSKLEVLARVASEQPPIRVDPGITNRAPPPSARDSAHLDELLLRSYYMSDNINPSIESTLDLCLEQAEEEPEVTDASRTLAGIVPREARRRGPQFDETTVADATAATTAPGLDLLSSTATESS